MNQQNLILLSLTVIVLCFVGPTLTQLAAGQEDNSSPHSRDTTFIPKFNFTDFAVKRQIITEGIDELIKRKGTTCNQKELEECQDMNRKLTWQLLVNFIKSSKRIQELAPFEEKWKTICVDWELVKKNLEDKNLQLQQKANLDKITMQNQSQAINRLSAQLEQAKRPCPDGPDCGQFISKINDLESELQNVRISYSIASSQLSTCKLQLVQEQAKGKEETSCQKLQEQASSVIKDKIAELNLLVKNGQAGLDKDKIIQIINSAQQYLANPINPEVIINNADSILSELVAGLQSCATKSQKRRELLSDCMEKYKTAKQALQDCEQNIDPFLKK